MSAATADDDCIAYMTRCDAAAYSRTGVGSAACWMEGGAIGELRILQCDAAVDNALRSAHLFGPVLLHLHGEVVWRPALKRFEADAATLR